MELTAGTISRHGAAVVDGFFSEEYLKEFRKNRDVKESVLLTMDNLSTPIFLTSITTATAFLMLIFSPVSAMIGYGVSIAFGIMWAWILSITLMPSLIILFKWDADSKSMIEPSYVEKMMKRFGKLVTKRQCFYKRFTNFPKPP